MPSEPAPEETAQPQRTAIGLPLLLALALLVGGVWWSAGSDEPPPSAPEGDAAGAPVVAGPTSFAELEREAAQEMPAAVPASAGDEVELCGGHWVKAAADGKPVAEEVAKAIKTSFDDIAKAALVAMAASSSPRVRAASHYYHVQTYGADEPRSHRQALARLAQDTDDAQIYAWAYRACLAAPGEGECMQVSAAQWARIEPENAEPWLAMAMEADARGDPPARDEAMFRVGSARYHQTSWSSLGAAFLDHAPRDERLLIGLDRIVLHAWAIETEVVPWLAADDYCSAKAIGDANRRETCDRVAGLLAQRSTRVIARGIGADMARRVAWRAEGDEGDAGRSEAAEMAARMKSAGQLPADRESCDAIRARVDAFRDSAELGEAEALRRERELGGHSLAKLAAVPRQYFEWKLRQADVQKATATGAASAASATTIAQR